MTARGGAAIPERYFILKDMQVLGNDQVLDQQDSAFCAPYDLAYVQRNGYCQGRNTSAGDGDYRPPPNAPHPGLHHLGNTGADYTGGLWYFTVNGDVYPQIPAPKGSGELWRVVNAGASRAYDLVLRDDEIKAPIPFQLVSLDGAAVAPPAGTTAVRATAESANAMGTVPCPGSATTPSFAAFPARSSSTPPVCATHLVMFPGARAEIWVPQQSHSATLLTEMVSTGPAGDRWPQANLAHIAAALSAAAPALLDVRPLTEAILTAKGRTECEQA